MPALVYEYLYGENPYNDVTSDEFKAKVKKTEYDVLLGGFPCQAFSIAGLKAGFEDKTRGTLFFDIAQILNTTKPKAFLLENVQGLLSHNKGNTFKVILETLESIGYQVVGANDFSQTPRDAYKPKKENFVRTPLEFGIPQKRARVFLMGFRKDLLPDGYVLPELPYGKPQSIYKDLTELLDQDVDSSFYLSQKMMKTLKKHKEKHQSKNSGFGFQIVNLEPDSVANTIMATGGSGKERNLIYQPKQHSLEFSKDKNDQGIRYMTPNEWGKLQGFVNYAFIENGIDKFSIPESISKTQRYKLFGNSVCIPVIEEMAKTIFSVLEDINNK
ncbi:DNA (cytosine-5-)-methyltransferase [Mycoplasma sp. Ms02]|uniref:DNA (cytosine-5-)-methyltransferase n=1 Tax=Mycoplasma sp. Ms02 TaxID=353851 RepID=UPI001C89CED2|nr:DNA (cytosine-5-)-methyltransferase [Mycoplasma sp. Ms02]QZE12234.1 DNA (cytosine-5-)-methyltransferase [Mycoplasma sp. Ms02]